MSNMPPDPDASDSREDGAPTKEACAKLYQEVGLLPRSGDNFGHAA